MTEIERRNVVEVPVENGPRQQFNPVRIDAAKVGVHHDARFRVQPFGDGEDGAERAPFSGQPVVWSGDALKRLDGVGHLEKGFGVHLGFEDGLLRAIF